MVSKLLIEYSFALRGRTRTATYRRHESIRARLAAFGGYKNIAVAFLHFISISVAAVVGTFIDWKVLGVIARMWLFTSRVGPETAIRVILIHSFD